MPAYQTTGHIIFHIITSENDHKLVFNVYVCSKWLIEILIEWREIYRKEDQLKNIMWAVLFMNISVLENTFQDCNRA